MKNIYSPLPQEKVSISIEFSPVWEIALGIAGYTHSSYATLLNQMKNGQTINPL